MTDRNKDHLMGSATEMLSEYVNRCIDPALQSDDAHPVSPHGTLVMAAVEAEERHVRVPGRETLLPG